MQKGLKAEKVNAGRNDYCNYCCVALGVVLWRGKAGLEEKNADYQAQITELQSQIDDENKRSDELSEYEKYVKTKKFVEEIAKNKFGLIYPDELVFKPNNK